MTLFVRFATVIMLALLAFELSARDQLCGGLTVISDQRLDIQPLDLAIDNPPLAADHDPVGAVGAAQQ